MSERALEYQDTAEGISCMRRCHLVGRLDPCAQHQRQLGRCLGVKAMLCEALRVDVLEAEHQLGDRVAGRVDVPDHPVRG